MERAKARKLQPGFIRAFFIDAFRHLGGRITEREPDRYEITRVPSAVRSAEREAKLGGIPIQPVYERVTFEKDLIRVDEKPPAELLSPGHPLLSAVIYTIDDRYGSLLQRGTVFVDPDDPGHPDQPDIHRGDEPVGGPDARSRVGSDQGSVDLENKGPDGGHQHEDCGDSDPRSSWTREQ